MNQASEMTKMHIIILVVGTNVSLFNAFQCQSMPGRAWRISLVCHTLKARSEELRC